MTTVRDRLWVWCHQAGSYKGQYNLPGPSRMTPAAAAVSLGVPNLIMVVYGGQPRPPFDQHAIAMRPLDRVVWSVVGDASSEGNDLEAVISLSQKFPNITGAMMDDFFRDQVAEDESQARCTLEEAQFIHDRLHAAPRPLDLFVVLYAHQLELPVRPYLDACDAIAFWTWRSEDLAHLEDNFARAERLAPEARKLLGCYMWDFGNGRPIPLELMQKQCELGLQWLEAGRIEGMIFLAGNTCDLEIEAVEYARQWIARVADAQL